MPILVPPFGDSTCPICNNFTLFRGEIVDFFQVTPSYCEVCGYIQPRNIQEFDDLLPYIEKCWELQFWPWGNN